MELWIIVVCTHIENEYASLLFITPRPPAIITSAEVIIAEYDAILSQWERANFYNHLSNYTNMQYQQLFMYRTTTQKKTLNRSIDHGEFSEIDTLYTDPLQSRENMRPCKASNFYKETYSGDNACRCCPLTYD